MSLLEHPIYPVRLKCFNSEPILQFMKSSYIWDVLKTLSQLNVTIAVQTNHFQFRTKFNFSDLKIIENMFIWVYFLFSIFLHNIALGGTKKPPRGGPTGATKLTESPWNTGFSFVKKKYIIFQKSGREFLLCKCLPPLG